MKELKINVLVFTMIILVESCHGRHWRNMINYKTVELNRISDDNEEKSFCASNRYKYIEPFWTCNFDEEASFYASCEPQCNNPNMKCIDNCFVTINGCICKKGLYRSNSGMCVPLEECELTDIKSAAIGRPDPELNCKKNEEISICNNCESTCVEGEEIACARDCHRASCVCKPGFYRSVNGNCVTMEECSISEPDINMCVKKLGPNAVISNQITCPSKLCYSDYSIVRKFQEDCHEFYPGCICKEGFIIYKDGICHEASKCAQFAQ